MKRLKKECGVTMVTLDNLGLLSALHGSVRFMIHSATTEHSTLVAFHDGYIHRATGFASGYGGEGPHGLLTAIQIYLKRNDITIEHIASWLGRDYMILPGKGIGKSHNYHFTEDGVVIEIW